MYNIFNHNEIKNRPLALVAMHPKENFINYGVKYVFYKRYASADIKNVFNLSLKEFLSFKPYECELMFKIAETHNRAETQKTNDLLLAMKSNKK